MLAILAPVPAEILESAFEVREPVVAFGSGWPSEDSSGAGSFEFFSHPELQAGIGTVKVLIYGSQTDLTRPSRYYKPGHVTAIATYAGFEPSKAGVYSRPEERPKFALYGDTPAVLFWKVTGLRPLKKPLPLKSLKLRPAGGSGKLRSFAGTYPRGPLLVMEPSEALDQS